MPVVNMSEIEKKIDVRKGVVSTPKEPLSEPKNDVDMVQNIVKILEVYGKRITKLEKALEEKK